MTATPSSSGECITPSPTNRCYQHVAAGSNAWTWSSYGVVCCNCWQMTSSATTTTATTTTTTPMSGSCPSDCLLPVCQPGNPSNGGQQLVSMTCTAFCSVVYGTARYCGTGSVYDSTGSVNCQGCAATTTTTTTTTTPTVACPASCSTPTCQDGNPSNGGQALVTGKCTAFCSVVYGATRYCGTGSTYDSTGSVNCQGCATTLVQISAETHEEDASMLQVKVKTSQAAADDLNKTFSQSLAVEVQCQAGSANAAYCGFNVPASGGLYPNQNKCWAGINTGATATGSCTAPSQGNSCWLQVATTLYPQSLAWVWYVTYLTCCNCWQMKDWTPSLIQEETQELPSDEDEVAHIQTFVHQTDL
ncbi:unnamed protein product [Polarella glacialis]|uniref:Uncharacterized protein n=1 Tax=Polarella glacialis TaxID=89957 RepID=A0A813L040_POLGL|nr:unnamed protein product [Polarella glacialis]